MQSIKTKKRIGQGLYVLAIILLLINIYHKGKGTENVWIEAAAWISLLVASFYMIYFSKVKKRIEAEKKISEL